MGHHYTPAQAPTWLLPSRHAGEDLAVRQENWSVRQSERCQSRSGTRLLQPRSRRATLRKTSNTLHAAIEMLRVGKPIDAR